MAMVYSPQGLVRKRTVFLDNAERCKEKNRVEALMADVSKKTKQLIRDAETMGKMPTFPVVFDITTVEPLADIYVLLDCKKKLEK